MVAQAPETRPTSLRWDMGGKYICFANAELTTAWVRAETWDVFPRHIIRAFRQGDPDGGRGGVIVHNYAWYLRDKVDKFAPFRHGQLKYVLHGEGGKRGDDAMSEYIADRNNPSSTALRLPSVFLHSRNPQRKGREAD